MNGQIRLLVWGRESGTCKRVFLYEWYSIYYILKCGMYNFNLSIFQEYGFDFVCYCFGYFQLRQQSTV